MSAAILVVDDEANIRRMLAGLLEQDGYTTVQAPDAKSALERLEAEEPDAILLDLALPGRDGLSLLEEIALKYPLVPVVMMSGRATLTDAVRATKLGAFHFIEKPLSPEAVLLTVKGAIDLRRARERSRALSEELGHTDPIVGSSAAMRAIRDMIETVAASDARVLITGESGTGKELVAAALHTRSRRTAGPFIRVNSAAIPRELIESEMFGHEKGAFSGAIQARRGRFEQADGGTLFLDEIADLGPDAQAKLLRVIETGELTRVGGERPIRVDVRIVAATNRDLKEEVAAGRFRDDLFYRLNVIPLHVPPLRARREDVPELVRHFMTRYQQRTGRQPPMVARDAMKLLEAHNWPGNVRELANLCERVAILCAGREITSIELQRLFPEIVPASTEDERPFNERLDDYERSLIRAALLESDGNVAEAARRLKTDRPNLYRRMRRLGIDS